MGVFPQISGLNEDYLAVVNEIAEILASKGKRVSPFHSPNLDLFSTLSHLEKRRVISEASIYRESLKAESKNFKSELANDPFLSSVDGGYQQALWFALKEMGFRPSGDIFGYMQSDNIVEVYDSQGIQIWRNLNFFDVCSYSLEEMFCISWMERYERDASALGEITQLLGEFIGGRRSAIAANIHNLIKETKSQNLLHIRATHQFIAPLFLAQTDLFAGLIVVSEGKVVSQAAKVTPILRERSPSI